MLTSNDLNKIVSFNVYPAAIIGSTFDHVKVLAILDAESVFAYNIDPAALHANVYPSLPVGTPNKYDAYSWVKLKFQSGDLAGQVTCIGLPWIEDSSIVVHENVQMRVTISNVTPADLPKIRNSLLANGFNQLNIEMI